MSAFRASAESLAALALESTLPVRIAEHVRYATGARASDAEMRSWERSLPVLARDLVDAGLGSVEILVEHRLPLTSKRVDAIVAGVHPRTGEDSYVVVELKQWSSAEAWEDNDELVLVEGRHRGPRLNPATQVHGYCELIADFTASLRGRSDVVKGVAYLHNATDHAVRDVLDQSQDEHSRVFTAQRRGEFLDYLQTHLSPAPGAPAADRFLSSAIRPSRQLLAVAAEEIKERERFTLLDEQRVAYEHVLHAVEHAHEQDSKRVIVVKGGPGSGKSVIALSILGELSRRGRTVVHATGSKSFTETLRKYAGKGSTRLKNLFRYFNSFMKESANSLDVLIADEAHRIRATSENRFTKASDRTGRPQVEELISVASVPVFLLDEHQVVKPGEIGTYEAIEEAAARRGLEVIPVDLEGQFRCGGSAVYERWVKRLLGLEPGGPAPWEGDERFEVQVADSPSDLEAILATKRDEGYSARMSAGFCWPWSNPRPDGSLVADVQIGDWARPWNVKSERSVGGAPGRSYWATDPAGFGQVGCIYTAQGFEYDWSGVIIGPDLVARDGELTSVRSENRDPAFRNRNSVSDAEFDRNVRNVYKVLLTRGMVGTVVYATDRHTREFLAELIEGVRRPASA
ncbi:DUF2075 domain-containing protein [Actinobacteria bacterium YIM 96077]|uniref:ATP-binding protein n=1 Tax=Phytoactinopolyspora halophila TaxID=1981511 RepID=A0A329QSP8_9ACTN|nr:DUF2075 domain-containing protein [Phytoactinopolyspora halophila]AYY14963.1 DUF2075 domain-containing protein [Actinobacteria bacterium YIM 96077]RAW15420.1 ATP-binding protein [Phytoactinopolyspora halophila]